MPPAAADVRNQGSVEEYDETVYESIYESIYETYLEDDPPFTNQAPQRNSISSPNAGKKSLRAMSEANLASIESMITSKDPTTKAMGLDALRDSTDHDTSTKLLHAFACLKDTNPIIMDAAVQLLRMTMEDDPLPLLQDCYDTMTSDFHDSVMLIAGTIVFKSQKMTDASISILSMFSQVHLDLALFILTQMMEGFRQRNVKNVEVTSHVLHKLESYIDRAIDTSAMVEFPSMVIKKIADSLTVALNTKGLGIKEIAEDYIMSLTRIVPADLLAIEFTRNKLPSVKSLTSVYAPGPVPKSGLAKCPPRRPSLTHPPTHGKPGTSSTSSATSGGAQVGSELASMIGSGAGSVTASVHNEGDAVGSSAATGLADSGAHSAGITRYSVVSVDESGVQQQEGSMRVNELKYVCSPMSFNPNSEEWISMLSIPRTVLPGICDSSWQVRKETLEITEKLFNPFLPHPQPTLSIAQCENRKNNKTIVEEILMRTNEVLIGDQNVTVVATALCALRVMLMYLPTNYYSPHSIMEIAESILQKLKSRKPALAAPCYSIIDVILSRFLTLEEFVELPILQNALPEVPRDVIDSLSPGCTYKAFMGQLTDYIANDKKPIPPSKSALNTYLYIEFCQILQRQMTFLLFILLGGVYSKSVLQEAVPKSVLDLIHAYVLAPNLVLKLSPSETTQALLMGMGVSTPVKPKEATANTVSVPVKIDSVAGLSSLQHYPVSFVAYLCRSFLGDTSLRTLGFIKICTGTLTRDMSSEVRNVSKAFNEILTAFISFHRSNTKQKPPSRGSSPMRKPSNVRTPQAGKSPSGQKSISVAPATAGSNCSDLDIAKSGFVVASSEYTDNDGSRGASGMLDGSADSRQKRDISSSPEQPKTPQRVRSAAKGFTPNKARTHNRIAPGQTAPQITGTAGKTKFVYYNPYDFPTELFRACSFDSGTNFKRARIMLRPPAFLLYKIGPVCTHDDLAFAETLSTPKHDFSQMFRLTPAPDAREGIFYTLKNGPETNAYIEPLVDQFSLFVAKNFMASTQKKPGDKGQNFPAIVVSIFRTLGMLIVSCENESTLACIIPAASIILNTIYNKDLSLYNSTISAYIYHILTFIPYRNIANPAKLITAWKKLLTAVFDIHGLVPVYYTLFAITATICNELESEESELNVRNGPHVLVLAEYLHEVVKFLHDKFDPTHSVTGFSLRTTSELLIHVLEMGAYLHGGCTALTGPTGFFVRVASKLLAMLVYFLRNVNGLEQMDPTFLGKVLDCEVMATLKGLYSSGLFEAACMHSVLNCLRTIRDADKELKKYIQSILIFCNKTDFPRLTVSTRAPKTCMCMEAEADRGKIQNCDFRKPTNLYNVIRDLSAKNPGIYDALANQGLVSTQKYAVTPERPAQPQSRPESAFETRDPRLTRDQIDEDASRHSIGDQRDSAYGDVRQHRSSKDDASAIERASVDADRSSRERGSTACPTSGRARRSISMRDNSSLCDDDPNQTSKYEGDKSSNAGGRHRTVLHSSMETAIKAQRSIESLEINPSGDESAHSASAIERTIIAEGDKERQVPKKAASTQLRKLASSMRNKSSTLLQMKLTNVPDFLQPYYRAPGFEIPVGKIPSVLQEYETMLSAEKDSMVRSDLTIAMIQALSLYEENSIDSTKMSRKLLQLIDDKIHSESNANAIDYYLLLLTELTRTGNNIAIFEQSCSIGLINMLGMTRRQSTKSYAIQALNMCINCHVILTASTVTKSHMGSSILKALNGTSASYSTTSPTTGIIATIRQETLNWILSDMLPSIIAFISESELSYTFDSSVVLHQIWTSCEELLTSSKSTTVRATCNEILRMLGQVQSACKEQHHKKGPAVSKPNREAILGKELAQTINELEETAKISAKNSTKSTDDAIKRALMAERNRLSSTSRGSVGSNRSSCESDEGFSTTAVYLGGLAQYGQDQEYDGAASWSANRPGIPRHSGGSRQSIDHNEGFGVVKGADKRHLPPLTKDETDSYMVDELNDPSFRSVANSSLLERHSEPDSRNISRTSHSSTCRISNADNHNHSHNHSAMSMYNESMMIKSGPTVVLHDIKIPFTGRHENRFTTACKIIGDSSFVVSLLTPYIFERQASISATDIRVVRHIANDSMKTSDITAPMIDLNGVDPNSLIPIRSVHFNEDDVNNGILAILKQYEIEASSGVSSSEESVATFSSIVLLYAALALSNDFVTEGWRPLATTVINTCKCIEVFCKYIKDPRDFKILVGPLLVRMTTQSSYQEKLAIQRTLDALLEHHQALETSYHKAPGKRIVRHFIQNYIEVFEDPCASIQIKYVALKAITEFLEMIVEGVDSFERVQSVLEAWFPTVFAFFRSLCMKTFKKECKISDELAGKAFVDYIKTEFKDPSITVEYINGILQTKESFLMVLCTLSNSETAKSFERCYPGLIGKLSTVEAALLLDWVGSTLEGKTHKIDIKEATMVADMFSPGSNEYVEYDIVSINESFTDDAADDPSSKKRDLSKRLAVQSLTTPTLVNSAVHTKDGGLSNDPLIDRYGTTPMNQRTDTDSLIRDAEQILGQSLRQTLSSRAVVEDMMARSRQHEPMEEDKDMAELFSRMGNLVTDVDADLLDGKVSEELRSSKLYKNLHQNEDRSNGSHSTPKEVDVGPSSAFSAPAPLSSYTAPSLSIDDAVSFNNEMDKDVGPAKATEKRSAKLVVSTIAEPIPEKAIANPSPSKENTVVRLRGEIPPDDRYVSLARRTEGLPLAISGVTDQIDYRLKVLDIIEELHNSARDCDTSMTDAMAFTLKSLVDSMIGTILKTFDTECVRKLLDAMLYIKRQLTTTLQTDTTIVLFVTSITSFLQNYMSNLPFRKLVEARDFQGLEEMPVAAGTNKPSFYREDITFEVIKQVQRSISSLSGSGTDPVKITIFTLLVENCLTLLGHIIDSSSATHLIKIAIQMFTVIYEEGLAVHKASDFPLLRPYYVTNHTIVQNILNSLLDKLTQIVAYAPQDFSQDIAKHHKEFMAKKDVPQALNSFSGTLFSIFMVLSGYLAMYPNISSKQHTSYALAAGHNPCPSELSFLYPRSCIVTCIKRLSDDLDDAAKDVLSTVCGLEVISQFGNL